LYIYDGRNWQIALSDSSNEEIIISSLLNIRSLVIRSRILYEHNDSTKMLFGDGLLLNDELILTCAHNLDPNNWSNQTISFTKIYVYAHDPADQTLFSHVEWYGP
jgi:hypothetical protein